MSSRPTIGVVTRIAEICASGIQQLNAGLLAELAREMAENNEVVWRENPERPATESASTAEKRIPGENDPWIRTPMQGVLGMTYFAMTPDCFQEINAYLAELHTSAESLRAIINDILDRLEDRTRKMELESRF